MNIVATQGSPKLTFSYFNVHKLYLPVCSDSELILKSECLRTSWTAGSTCLPMTDGVLREIRCTIPMILLTTVFLKYFAP